MIKNYLILSLLCSFLGFSQFNSLAPWMEGLDGKKEEFTIYEISSNFNEYWKTHDRKVRGSGHNPYKRWEYHWANNVNDQGYLISPEDLWLAWNLKNNKKQFKNSNLALPTSNWQPVGPFSHTNTGSWSSGQGRVNIVAVDPNNSNILYFGTPAGGIWKSTNSGIDWLPLTDELPQIGVSGIAIDYSNSNIIYIATGDKDAGDSFSVGVFKSTDGGLTWNPTGTMGGSNPSRAGDLIIHPTNSQILWCATNTGIFKTINAGISWTRVQTGSFSQGNIRLKPNDPNVIYGVTNNTFYKSSDAGDTFTAIATGLPASSGRLVLDVTPANSDYIYILSVGVSTSYAFQGIYRSTDSGLTFTATNTTTNVLESTQAWYDLTLAVSDTNADEIYTGCLNIWKSTDGGTSVVRINNWSSPTAASYTHADIHYLGFQAGRLYCGSDGGIYVSQNGGTNFTDLTATAQISQYYKIAVSKQSSANMVGGLQDNGGYAYSGNQWKNYYGADGMDTTIDPNNPNLYYGFIQYGGTMYISNNAGNSRTGTVSAPEGKEGNWVTPLVTNSVGGIYSGFDYLYKLVGNTWQQQNTVQTGAGNIDYIEMDPTDNNIIYMANGSGLYKSVDRGLNFDLIYSAHTSITSIEINNSNNAIVYLTTNGTGGRVLKSTDGGISFSNITNGIPNIGKNIIVHQPRNTKNPLFVGTSLGVYYLDDTMSSWQPFDANLPNVAVKDLEINIVDAKLIAATYGRGVWQTAIPIEIPENDLMFVAIQNPGLNINCNSNVSPKVEVKNNGSNTISEVTINYVIDGSSFNYVWNGTITSNQQQLINLPSIALARGLHSISVNSTITNDAYSDNNTGLKQFYLNDGGAIGVTNTFTNSSDELISYNEGVTGSQWVRGVKTGGAMSSGTNTIYTTNLSGNYPNNIKSYLVSQCYNLSNVTNPQISFAMKFDLEQNYDVAYVQYSKDFGASWSILGTSGPNWYNSNIVNCANCQGGQWTGTNTTLKTYTYPLNTLNSETNVIFRIVFHSDQLDNKEGVNIDDFVINGTLSNQNFELNNVVVYPNPSKGIFNISLGDVQPTAITVYDLTGKIIISKKDIQTSNFETSLDLTNAALGIYFVKITANDQSTVKRIIKE